MKRQIRNILSFIVAVAIVVGSFSVSADAASKGYQFKNKGVTVSIGSAAKKFIQKAGKPVKTKVSKSCAYKGKDRTYQYKNFILYTYSNSNNGPEYVNGITFLNSKVSTKEGIKIGSTLSAVQKKYGKTKERFGIYTYKKGKSKLQIEVTDGKVSNIRYAPVK